MEDLLWRKGYAEGVERGMKLLDSLLALAQEDVIHIRAAQKLLREEEAS
ncbi:MAG: hypothetical protein GTO63_30245 [Anaerolineae bacterium]|nr:hypothetical protein [Anaerolineae bacterium]NIN98986.1 hypothetical protein [Anaerolineae bacterium]